jgi:hypothetical protein
MAGAAGGAAFATPASRPKAEKPTAPATVAPAINCFIFTVMHLPRLTTGQSAAEVLQM